MNTATAPKKRVSQQYYEDKAPVSLTPRDQVLSRVERILAEQFIVPFPGDDDFNDIGMVEMINLEAIVEVAKIPPVVRPARKRLAASTKTARSFSEGDSINVAELTAEEQVLEKEVQPVSEKISLTAALGQLFIVGFIISCVFIFGILVGRGHIWESGAGYDLVTWVETKAGWSANATSDGAAPEVVEVTKPAVVALKNVKPIGAPPAKEVVAPSNQSLARASVVAKASQDWDGANWFKKDAAANISRETLVFQGESPSTVEAQKTLAPAPVVNKKVTPPVVAAVTPASNGGKFAVQVAMVPDEVQAKKGMEKLESQGFTAYYYRHTNGWWALRVGYFSSYQAAGGAQAKLTQLGYNSPYISRMNN